MKQVTMSEQKQAPSLTRQKKYIDDLLYKLKNDDEFVMQLCVQLHIMDEVEQLSKGFEWIFKILKKAKYFLDVEAYEYVRKCLNIIDQYVMLIEENYIIVQSALQTKEHIEQVIAEIKTDVETLKQELANGSVF